MNLQEERFRESFRERSRQKKRQRRRRRSSSSSSSDEQFEANQEILRSLLRIQQNRQRNIDRFVKVLLIYEGKLAYDPKIKQLMMQPRICLARFNEQQIQELIPSFINFQKAQNKLSSLSTHYASYWEALRILSQSILFQKKGMNPINPAIRAKVQQILSKPTNELKKMEGFINTALQTRPNDPLWSTVRSKIQQKINEQFLVSLYKNYKQNHPEQENTIDKTEEQYEALALSPILGPASLVNPKLITEQINERIQRAQINQHIFKQQFQKWREKLQQNLSLPKNHNILNTAIVNDAAMPYDFITQQIIEFEKYKRLQQDQQQFDDWVPCETQGRFRDRKPQYINRKRVTIQWNKYNTLHYNDDNPPPKTIQGYKFNIFYPDLYDKQKTPQYFLQTTESPDYCIIKFKAGPPYKDIAFKILRKQWDFTQKSGFQAIFHKGILQLYFNFKKPKFRI